MAGVCFDGRNFIVVYFFYGNGSNRSYDSNDEHCNDAKREFVLHIHRIANADVIKSEGYLVMGSLLEKKFLRGLGVFEHQFKPNISGEILLYFFTHLVPIHLLNFAWFK